MLLTCLLLVALTAWADDFGPQQGCRRGKLRPQTAASRAPLCRSGRVGDTYIGQRRQLVVLAAFSDRTFKGDAAATLQQWNRIFNEADLAETPFVGSVHDYFYAQSYGRFDLTFDLAYVQLSSSYVKYGSTADDDENSQYLVDDVVDVLLTRDIDWSRYDWDGDGYVNQLLIVYAGKGSSYGGFGGDKNSIWPHQWWLSQHLDLTTSDPEDYRDARTVSSGGITYTVDSYCCLAELYSNGSYGTFGTICHEYSHCFGFPDFYYGSGTSVVGSWDLMDYGNNNGDGFCPCGYSAHERMLMGWLTPTELTEAASITGMPALADEPRAYLVRNSGYADEFYLVENRQQSGWDQSLPGSGIVVFHIDYDADVWSTDMPNSSSHKRYAIFPANNRTSSYYTAGWAYPYGTNDALTDMSSPAATLLHANAGGTLLMGKPLTGMAVTAGLASFDFMGGAPSSIVPHPSTLNPPLSTIYDLQGRPVGTSWDALPHGTYIVGRRKVIK